MVSLRVKLIDEEFKELCNSKTIIDQLDAIGDLLYVIYGTGVCFGFNLNKEYTKYCIDMMNASCIKSEIQFFNGMTNFHKTKYIHNIIEIPTIDKNIKLEPKYILQTEFMNFSYQIKRLSYHLLMSDIDGICKSLIKMLVSIYITGIMCHYDIDKLFSIVHESNMTKLCSNLSDAEKSVMWYIEHEKERYTQPKYELLTNGYYVIYDDATGKRLKSINFSPPNIDVNIIYNPNI